MLNELYSSTYLSQLKERSTMQSVPQRWCLSLVVMIWTSSQWWYLSVAHQGRSWGLRARKCFDWKWNIL